jgi:hypothetical protein
MADLAVIMSVYQNDQLRFLKESVQSILNQSLTKFDFYIVFDGPVSADIDTYISSINDERIKLYRREKNEGLAIALNYLLEIVLNNPEYNLIARMDADDISLPERLEKQYKFLSENPGIGCVGCWFREIDEEGRHLANRELPIDHEALKKRYLTRSPFAHPSVVYRRQLIEKSGFYPTNTVLMEDNVLWGKALLQGFQFANIPEYLFEFRISKGFYKRRSGFRYGWCFVITKLHINKELEAPIRFNIILICFGLLKMMPVILLKPLYRLTK